jgi:succinoglycan biosynthesis transport protein ExoP
MDMTQFLMALRARRKAFVLVLVATIVAAIAVALAVPKKYVASATVLIDARDEQAMTPARISPRERAGYVATQIDLVQSGRVASRVAKDLKLAQRPGVREAFEQDTGGAGSIDDWIGERLLEVLKVKTSAGNILILEYSSSDPKHAAQLANGFAKAYLDTALEMRNDPSREASDWFQAQMKGLRNQVTQAQSKLTAYQKQKGILAVSDRLDVEATRLSELSTQLLAARNATYDAISRHQLATEVLQRGASPDAIPDVLANAYVNGVKADLSRAEARLEEASAVLGENHPTYQRIAGEIQAGRGKLKAEMAKLVAGLGNAVQQSRKREQELQQAMKAQETRILALNEHRADLAVLTRDIDNAQRAYDAVLTRYQTTQIESRANSTNLALLTPAVEPVHPAHPKLGLISALSVLVGLLFAGGVVYVLESLDRRVRSRADLEARLAVPSLGRLSRWQPSGGRLLPAPMRAARALPHPW